MCPITRNSFNEFTTLLREKSVSVLTTNTTSSEKALAISDVVQRFIRALFLSFYTKLNQLTVRFFIRRTTRAADAAADSFVGHTTLLKTFVMKRVPFENIVNAIRHTTGSFPRRVHKDNNSQFWACSQCDCDLAV